MKLHTHPGSAFSLVEIVLALGVAAFCLVGIFGLLPIGLASNQNAVEQTAAAGVAMAVATDLRATPTATTNLTSPRFGFTVPPAGSSAAGTSPQTLYLREDASPSAGRKAGDAPVPGESRYRVTAVFTPPASGQKLATAVRLLVTWPAMADANPARMPSNYTGSFETMIALNRN